MADDQQNPFTMMGMMNMMQPNKYEPLQFKNRPLSLQGFRGPATDARGNVIQSYADAQTQHDAWNQAHPAAPAQGDDAELDGRWPGAGRLAGEGDAECRLWRLGLARPDAGGEPSGRDGR